MVSTFGRLVVLAGLTVALGPAADAVRAAPPAERLTGTLRTAERPYPQSLELVRIEGVDYVDLRLVARLFHGTKYWRAELEKMVLKVSGHRVRLTVGSPYVFVDERGVNLLAPVRWHEGQIYVPIRLATDVLDDLVGETVRWDRSTRTLTIGTGDPNMISATYDVRKNGTVVEFRLTELLAGRLEYPRPDRVVLHVPGGVVGEQLSEGLPGRGLLDSLEVRQDPGEAVFTLHLGPLGGTAEVLTRVSPPRLLVAVSEGLPDDIPLPEFERRAATRARNVRVVVIDPGHGGSDAGIVAENGVAEKDMTLALAQHLREALQDLAEDLEVVLTREDDRFLSNEDRARVANAAGADVFVSLHGNGWFHESMGGFSVGTFGGGVAHAPSEFARWGEPDPMVVRETAELAVILLEEMQELLQLPNRGVREASYAVLAGATMPAVLVECGFLTNREDSNRLRDPDFLRAMAFAIAEGVAEYRLQGLDR